MLDLSLGIDIGALRRGFSPSSLFAANEPGGWYDPSDLTTLFQDSAGITPVTAAGQSVGLWLDKSRGLVLGSELNDGLTDVANWVAFGTNVVAADGDAIKITFTAGQSSQGAYTFFRATAGLTTNLTPGVWYRLTGQAKVNTGSANVSVSTASAWNSAAITSTSYVDFTLYFLADNATTNYLSAANLSTGEEVWVRNLSVKALPGNHLSQSSSGQRAIYGVEPVGGRRNLFTYSEDFSNAAWTKGGATISTDATTAPDGTLTADKLVETATTGGHQAYSGVFTTVTGAATYSLRVKAAERSWVFLGDNTGGVYFDVANGAVGTTSGGRTGTITATANGFYICAVMGTWSGTQQVYYAVASGNGTTSYAGVAGNGLFIWGAQLETGSTATAYQKVVSAFDVTEAGKTSLSYIQFDGSDDGYVSPTITPGIDKAQVFAGVRKLSDAATGTLLETSVNAGANDGVIDVQAPSGAASNYRFGSRGTVGQNATQSGFSAPITNVFAGLGDISGDRATLRINGTQVAQSTADQGTGNYLAYPLYVGRRGGASLPLNGRIYSLIVRFGANLTADQIAQTENYVNSKTGAY